MKLFILTSAVVSLLLGACGNKETPTLVANTDKLTSSVIASEMVGEFPPEPVFVQDGHIRTVEVGEEFSLLFELPAGTGSSKQWGVVVDYPDTNIKRLKTLYVMQGVNERSNEVVLRAVGSGDVNLIYAIIENNAPVNDERRTVTIQIR